MNSSAKLSAIRIRISTVFFFKKITSFSIRELWSSGSPEIRRSECCPEIIPPPAVSGIAADVEHFRAAEKIYRSLRGHDFPVIIDPSAEVAPTVDIRHGTFIGPKAVVSVGAELGKFVIVNARAGVGHDAKLGDFSQVCPGATLSGHTTLGEHAFVATNASTVPGITIGAHAKVAAGTPVYRDLPADAVLSPFGVLKG